MLRHDSCSHSLICYFGELHMAAFLTNFYEPNGFKFALDLSIMIVA